MPHLLELVHQNTTINLAGSDITAPYVLVSDGWGPNVARRRGEAVGGRSPYLPTTELITLNIYAPNSFGVLNRLEALAELIEAAEAFERRETTTPVHLRVQIDGGSTVLTSRVLGYGSTEQSAFELPVEFLSDMDVYTIQGLTLRLERTGERYAPPQTSSVSAASDSGQVMQVFIGSVPPHRSPVRLDIGGFDPASTNNVPAGFVLMASTPNALRTYNIAWPSGNNANGWAVIASSASTPVNNDIVRYTPQSANTSGSPWVTLGPSFGGTHVGVYVTAFNPRSEPCLLDAALFSNDGQECFTRPTTIPPGGPYPIYLGSVAAASGFWLIAFRATSAAVGQVALELDRVALLDLNDPAATAVYVPATAIGGLAAGPARLVIDPQPLGGLEPRVYVAGNGWTRDVLPAGPHFLQMSGNEASVVATHLACSEFRWLATRTNGAVLQNTLQATRYPTYLTPR